MKYWYSADYHLGHSNIIGYTNRPFKSLEQMDSTIIRNHNSRVKDSDIVYHVGDFCFRNSVGGKKGEGSINKPEYYLKQLNGRIIFIKGNHDRNNSLKTNIERLVICNGDHRVNLVHKQEHADLNYAMNFVGHVHNLWVFQRIKNYFKFTDLINVGVDQWKFMPVTFDEIYKKYNQWIKTNEIIAKQDLQY